MKSCDVFLQVVLHLLLPGQVEQGVIQSNGKRLHYKLTGDLTCLQISYVDIPAVHSIVMFCRLEHKQSPITNHVLLWPQG